MNGSKLENILNDIIKRILDVVQPKNIILFGSAVRGEMGADSDIDLRIIVPFGCTASVKVAEIIAML